MRRAKKLEIMLEFLIFGIAIGIVEDLLAVTLTTDATVTWKMIGIIVLIAVPFAVLGELIADNIDFATPIERFLMKRRTRRSRK